MTQLISQQNPSIDIALDLRELNVVLRGRDDFDNIWNGLARQLVGKPVCAGKWLEMTEPRGAWKALVLDAGNLTVIDGRTGINVIDLVRPPEVRHVCKEHLKEGQRMFGAFFCPVCRDAKAENRLCESHVHFLENKYTAYCREHVPRCYCQQDCEDAATFECDRCRKPFSENLKRGHPNDALTLLCNKCYRYQFELCSNCEREGRKRLGKSHCAFPLGTERQRCGKRLCTFRHARQWQIWGPYWRGVVLCDDHYNSLRYSSPADLLWILIVSRAPAPFLQVKVKDLYRLRNIVAYVKQTEFSWSEMEAILRQLERYAEEQGGGGIKGAFTELLGKIAEVKIDLPVIEARLLRQVRDFYRRSLLRAEPESAILSLTVKRVFGREPNKTYRVSIRAGRDYTGRSMKGLLIGKGGALVNQLKNELGLQGIEFEE